MTSVMPPYSYMCDLGNDLDRSHMAHNIKIIIYNIHFTYSVEAMAQLFDFRTLFIAFHITDNILKASLFNCYDYCTPPFPSCYDYHTPPYPSFYDYPSPSPRIGWT